MGLAIEGELHDPEGASHQVHPPPTLQGADQTLLVDSEDLDVEVLSRMGGNTHGSFELRVTGYGHGSLLVSGRQTRARTVDQARDQRGPHAAGRRVCDEGAGGVALANALAHLDDPLGTTVVFDAAIWEGPARTTRIPVNPNLELGGGTGGGTGGTTCTATASASIRAILIPTTTATCYN